MITYNHENYIRQAIEGVLMQQTTFPIELIIGEDRSKDNTRMICQDYQLKYPDKIRLFLPESNLGMIQNFRSTLQASTGKYIAICEGDDYWTDPLKLQKQVDFLESNEEYSVCFHRYKTYDNELSHFREDGCGFLFPSDDNEGVTFCTEQFLKNWITQPLTMVFKNEFLNITLVSRYKYFRDMHLIYHLLQNGKGYLFSFDGGVYREHDGGIHSKQSLKLQCDIGVAVAKELFELNKSDTLLKDNYLRLLDWSIGSYKKNKWNFKTQILLIYNYFVISKSIKKFIKQVLK
jgi:glycosyltransferase involved in cell wall biosynthesis